MAILDHPDPKRPGHFTACLDGCTSTHGGPAPAGGEDLLVQLVQANYSNYASVSQALIDNLQEENTELRARLDAIRDRIGAALSGQYMPTPAHLESLLWPSPDVVRQYVRSH